MEPLEDNSIDYSPEATHELYLPALEIPRFEPDELIQRLRAYRDAGYVAIAGVLVGSWKTPVRGAVALHEKGRLFIDQGTLLGPYTTSYSISLPGVKFYAQS